MYRYLREEIDGAEESEPEMGFANKPFDGSLVLDDPVGEIDGDPFVSQVIEPFGSGVGFKQVPKISPNTHQRLCSAEREGKGTLTANAHFTRATKEEGRAANRSIV